MTTEIRADGLRRLPTTLALGAALIATARPADAGTLYAISEVLDEVYVIDTTTGAATLIGTTPLATALGGIAFDDAGVLHGVTQCCGPDEELYVLDPGAGTATLVGLTGGTSLEGALAYDASTDRLYSTWGTSSGVNLELVWYDPGTGAGTLIGNLGMDALTDVNGMTFLPDGTLLAYDARNYLLPSRILEIDPATGVTTVVGDGDLGDVVDASLRGGLAYDADTDRLYMSNAWQLWEIDPATGEGTLIGPHNTASGDLITGLTVLPDPEPQCMLGLDFDSVLWDVDGQTGEASNPRTMGGLQFFGGLARNDAGELFGTTSVPEPELYSIDEGTGAPTVIGPLGVLYREGGLDFDPGSGELYCVGGTTGLFTINTTTGAATVVGELLDEFGNVIDPSALAFDDAGNLFVLKTDSFPPEIYEVDASDASVIARVPITGLPFGLAGGLGFDDSTGTLFLTYESMLYTLNPYTGATVPVGPMPPLTALEIVGPCDPPRRRIRRRRQVVFSWSG